MKNIVLFYPSYERGGATKILSNLADYFSKKKINIYLIINKKINYNIPCISTNVSGVSDLLLNGKGGIIIKNNNVSDLYKAFLDLTSNYNIISKKLILAKKYLNRFELNNASLKYMKFLKKL
tara:strand:+ start:189 stop:554 length:366 start_codon:yes stop_codon:yes gene_type:complete